MSSSLDNLESCVLPARNMWLSWISQGQTGHKKQLRNLSCGCILHPRDEAEDSAVIAVRCIWFSPPFISDICKMMRKPKVRFHIHIAIQNSCKKHSSATKMKFCPHSLPRVMDNLTWRFKNAKYVNPEGCQTDIINHCCLYSKYF